MSDFSQKNKGLMRIYKAASYSFAGFAAAFRHEAAFRQELLLLVLFLPIAFLLEVSTVERILMVASLIVVLIVELLNSAVECAVDRVGFEHNELAGRAKDMGSAAVFLSLVLCIFIWVAVLWSKYVT